MERDEKVKPLVGSARVQRAKEPSNGAVFTPESTAHSAMCAILSSERAGRRKKRTEQLRLGFPRAGNIAVRAVENASREREKIDGRYTRIEMDIKRGK